MAVAGSLCSGYNGLALAHGVPLAWHAENDRHAATIHNTHWPDLPNLGDITAVDWHDVQPVDLLTAGFPCQPISQAGRRKVKNDDRWIWPHVAAAVRVLRPRLVWLENVPPLLRPWRDDDGWWNPAPVEEVAHDLAEAGYVGRWVSVRASDAGAPHQRERVFILATDARSARAGRDGGGASSQEEPGGRGEPHHSDPSVSVGEAPADADDKGWYRGTVGDRAPGGGLDIPSRDQPGRRRTPHLDWWRATPKRAEYAPAVEAWHHAFRPVPAFTVDGRLNPRFSEWMQGLPDGWVTDCPVPVTAQHKAIGNGVCVHAARFAWLLLTGQDTHTHTSPSRVLPTPTTSDAKGPSPGHAGTLAETALSLSLLPTPRTSDSNGPGRHGTGGLDLRTLCSQLLPRGSGGA